MNDKLKLLTELLLDNDARVDERDDAAIELQSFDDLRALDALIKIAKIPTENDIILTSCGESIGEIWVRNNSFNVETYKALSESSKTGVRIVVRSNNPELLKLLNDTSNSGQI